ARRRGSSRARTWRRRGGPWSSTASGASTRARRPASRSGGADVADRPEGRLIVVLGALNLDLDFEPGLSTPELRRAVERLETAIRKAHPEIKRIFLQAAALLPRS